ncbi:MAG: hypothetical protein JXA69_09455 [Phycisphaerae bacterium]|nr:hypothetical protein [Phycisphaerae bacterium]
MNLHRELLVAFWLAVMPAAISSAAAQGTDEPFDYFRNSWSVIGLKDYAHGTRITPDNELLLAGNRKLRLRFGRELTRLDRERVKTNLAGWLPIIQIHANDGPVRYDFTFWATPLPSVPDWKAAYHWPVAGEDYLNWITVRTTGNTDAEIPKKLRIEIIEHDKIQNTDFHAGAAEELDVACTVAYEPAQMDPEAVDTQLWLDRTVEFWKQAMLGGSHISVPCTKSNEALLAAHVCQLIAGDHGEVHGGEGFYDEFYIRDGAYQVMELEEAGFTEAARLAVGRYLEYQRPDGRFESQEGQFDANGQALWVLWQYYKMTGDRAWLEGTYPKMRRAVEWLMQARQQAPADSPFAGILPNALADGEYLWDGKHHIAGYDLWNLRGLLCTADCAKTLGRRDESAELEKEAADYRAAIDAAWKRTGLPYFPPSWESKGTHWGNTETLWPTELFKHNDPRVGATINEVRRNHDGGFCEGTIRWTGFPDAIHPYLSAYTTMASLARGEHEQVVEDYFWYLLHSSATHAFPEGIFFKRRFAWADTIPHVTGACNFAILLRHMIVHERDDELHLLAAVPDTWLADGREIRVERAPTHFGVLSLRVAGQKDGVRVDLRRATERPARRTLLYLPRSRRLVQPVGGIEVVYRDEQRTDWDYPTAVAEYMKDAPPRTRRIFGVVDLPLSIEIRADRAEAIDLSDLANTDPLTAPFGVKNPGKYVFAGLPVGQRVMCGVPFQVIDPAANQGRGFVVLHSPKAPAEAALPTEVEIPVGKKGKRLFLLGNVSGWGGADSGAGEWGAVAEYVIHYADGQHQVVPLITGQTIEDWTGKPTAADVFCGSRGDLWHLNVLGVELRPAVIDKIVFRDLDTPAAPVLVAITLER